MAKRKCARCERDQADAATICTACAGDLKRTLRHIGNLWPTLQEAITKQTVMGARTDHKPTKASEQPLPLNLHASAIGTRARTVLVGWTRVLIEDNSLTPPADTMPAIIDWLHGHVHILRRHEAAVDACDEITWLSGDITRAVDYPADRSVIEVGLCPESDEAGEPCPGDVWLHIPRDQGIGPWSECKACHKQWASGQLNQLGKDIAKRKAKIELQKSYQRKVTA